MTICLKPKGFLGLLGGLLGESFLISGSIMQDGWLLSIKSVLLARLYVVFLHIESTVFGFAKNLG